MTVRELLQRMALAFRENTVIRRFNIIQGELPVAYMHQKGKYGVILNLAVDAQTDPVKLQGIGKELALQIAGMAPQYVSRSNLDDAAKARIKEQVSKEVKDDSNFRSKSPEVIDKIVSGRIGKILSLKFLMEQVYIQRP